MKRVLRWIWQDLNDWVGTRLAIFLSSMGCFWIIFALTIIPLFGQHPQGVIGWVQYIVQTIFQGAALPVLGYVSDKGSQIVLKYIKEMHLSLVGKMDKVVLDIQQKVTEELTDEKAEIAELRQLVEGQAAIIAGQSDLMAEMEEVITDLHQIAAELHDHHIGGREHKKVR